MQQWVKLIPTFVKNDKKIRIRSKIQFLDTYEYSYTDELNERTEIMLNIIFQQFFHGKKYNTECVNDAWLCRVEIITLLF